MVLRASWLASLTNSLTRSLTQFRLRSTQVVEELLRNTNAEINVAMNSGFSPLMAAAQRAATPPSPPRYALRESGTVDFEATQPPPARRVDDSVRLVELLLLHGADPYQVDRRGRQAIHYAAAVGNIGVLEVLFERQGNIDVQTLAGATCLILAAGRGDLALVHRLLALGAKLDIEMNAPAGKTALFAAAEIGHTEICVELMTAGASLHIKCNGMTPRDVARANAYEPLSLLFVDGPQAHWEADDARASCARCSAPFSLLRRRVRSDTSPATTPPTTILQGRSSVCVSDIDSGLFWIAS